MFSQSLESMINIFNIPPLVVFRGAKIWVITTITQLYFELFHFFAVNLEFDMGCLIFDKCLQGL